MVYPESGPRTRRGAAQRPCVTGLALEGLAGLQGNSYGHLRRLASKRVMGALERLSADHFEEVWGTGGARTEQAEAYMEVGKLLDAVDLSDPSEPVDHEMSDGTRVRIEASTHHRQSRSPRPEDFPRDQAVDRKSELPRLSTEVPGRN